LGGNHNFEPDRQAAQMLLQVAPFMPQVLKQIRSFRFSMVQHLRQGILIIPPTGCHDTV
jgi:hypothetical protein